MDFPGSDEDSGFWWVTGAVVGDCGWFDGARPTCDALSRPSSSLLHSTQTTPLLPPLIRNKGISACAVCDGAAPIFRNKPIAVIGGCQG